MSPVGDGACASEDNGKLPMSPGEFMERWNRWAKQHGMSEVRKLTDDRRKKIKNRLGQHGWLDEFRQALARLPLPGEGWQPDMDWFIRSESSVTKILEGKYDWRGRVGGRPEERPATFDELMGGGS